ncbi:TonB-dependent receptor [Olivibacter ginsenosidimutans]|uniref:TonB-dependent receptor n=1 Tax=Olivibacter ginsenosidimutans TaxID=1176537 RepID=A0ABP9BZ46_9SPHI
MRQIHLFLFALACLCILSFPSAAQYTISGHVVDSTDGRGLLGAKISLITSKDSILKQTVAQQDGAFAFLQVPTSDYTLLFSYIGYRAQRKRIQVVDKNQTVRVGLNLDLTMLDSVSITVGPPPVVIKGDTTEFDARAYSTEAYADADALVAQIPGVEIDADGKVTAQGEDVQKIIVDGKEFFSSDPAVALKTLPADVIDKIQLIDEKSEQSKLTGFDDGNRHKIINIVTKPEKRHGYFGRLSGATGNDSRYNTGGYLNAFNGDRRISTNILSNNINQGNAASNELVGASGGRGGYRGGDDGGSGIGPNHRIALNYNNTWWKDVQFNADYHFNTSDKNTIRSANREILIGNNANQFNQSAQQTGRDNQSHAASLRIEYKKDSTQRLTVNPRINVNRGKTTNSNNTITLGAQQELINTSNRTNNGHNNAFTIGGSIDYGIRLSNRGRSISAHIERNYNRNRNEAFALSYNLFYEGESLDRSDTVNNRNNSYSNSSSWNTRITYTEPLDSNTRIMANASVRNNNSYSDRKMYDFLEETGQYSELNRQLSNEFRNDYRFYGAGLSYQFSRETVLFDLGIDYQQARTANDRVFPEEVSARYQFINYLPNANFTYRFSRDRRIRFNYNTSTNAPNVLQLQDVINNQNPLRITGGNPDLRQEFRHAFSINYNSVKRETGANFSVNLNGDFTKNRIVNSTFIAEADTFIVDGVLLGKGAQFSRPVNVNGYYSLRANISFGRPIETLKININSNTTLHQNRDVGLLNGAVSHTQTRGIYQRVGINSNISRKIIFSLSYSGNYSMVRNNNNSSLSYNSYNQTLRNDLTYIFWKGVRIASSLNYRYNTGMAAGYDQSFLLWNASIGKKLFKREEAEITFTAFDLLNSNTQVNRNITERYIEDAQTNILQRYFLLSFTYNLRNFGGHMFGGRGGRESGRSMRRGW